MDPDPLVGGLSRRQVVGTPSNSNPRTQRTMASARIAFRRCANDLAKRETSHESDPSQHRVRRQNQSVPWARLLTAVISLARPEQKQRLDLRSERDMSAHLCSLAAPRTILYQLLVQRASLSSHVRAYGTHYAHTYVGPYVRDVRTWLRTNLYVLRTYVYVCYVHCVRTHIRT